MTLPPKPPSPIRFFELGGRIRPLAEWQRRSKPEAKTLRVFADDYDLLARWPAMARMYGFDYVKHDESPSIMYLGFTLVRDAQGLQNAG